MALAKLDQLQLLNSLFSKVLTPPAVYEEVVVAGLRMGVPDARTLERAYDDRRLIIARRRGEPQAVGKKLGRGEEESILLAIEHGADRLLIDDRLARAAAEATFRRSKSTTEIQGTLGLIVQATVEGFLADQAAIELVDRLEKRVDIWLSPVLCRKVKETLARRHSEG